MKKRIQSFPPHVSEVSSIPSLCFQAHYRGADCLRFPSPSAAAKWVQTCLGAWRWQRHASCSVCLPPNVQETCCQRSLTKPISEYFCYWCLCFIYLFHYLFWHGGHIWDRLNNSRRPKKYLMDTGCVWWWKAMIFKWHWWDYYCILGH